MSESARWFGILALFALLVYSKSGGGVPFVEPTATAATYVYEKSGGPIPAAVMAGLNQLNRERHIRATTFDADTRDGTGEVPDQYKAALTAAQSAGLPCLVVTAGETVSKVVPRPTTLEAIVGAVP